jgi:hypothetical protein
MAVVWRKKYLPSAGSNTDGRLVLLRAAETERQTARPRPPHLL